MPCIEGKHRPTYQQAIGILMEEHSRDEGKHHGASLVGAGTQQLGLPQKNERKHYGGRRPGSHPHEQVSIHAGAILRACTGKHTGRWEASLCRNTADMKEKTMVQALWVQAHSNCVFPKKGEKIPWRKQAVQSST